MDEREPGTEPAEGARSSLQRVVFGHWEPLGGGVTLELSPRRTILVGRNGGGKSLLLEGLAQAASNATGVQLPTGPAAVTMTWERPGGSPLYYDYWWHLLEPPAGRSRSARAPSVLWKERAWRPPQDLLWSIEDGFLRMPRHAEIPMAPGSGLLKVEQDRSDGQVFGVPGDSWFLGGFLRSVQHLRAEFPRSGGLREPIVLDTGAGKRLGRTASTSEHARPLHELSERLAGWRDRPEFFPRIPARAGFTALVEVGRRIGIWQDVEVTEFSPISKTSHEKYITVSVDGVNLGLLSDGTLRMLDLLTALLDSDGGMLLIDEPELGIHPGLLARLLAELDAYGQDRQLVIATHSPQVVSWARPEELRLVDREQGQTRVRPLSQEQAGRVSAYLEDRGSLGDFVYDGGLDE